MSRRDKKECPPHGKIYISCLTTLNVDEHNRIPTTDVPWGRRPQARSWVDSRWEKVVLPEEEGPAIIIKRTSFRGASPWSCLKTALSCACLPRKTRRSWGLSSPPRKSFRSSANPHCLGPEGANPR